MPDNVTDGRPSAHVPCVPLRDVVTTFWSLRCAPESTSGGATLLPDGCVDLVFRLTSSLADALVVGVATGPRRPDSTRGTRLVGVSFAPGEASAVLGIPISELQNERVSLTEVIGRPAQELLSRVCDAGGTQDQVSLLECWLRQRLAVPRRPALIVEPPVRAIVRFIRRTHGTVRVSDLARHVGVSERTVERRFRELVGISPKFFSRVVRLHAVLKAIGHPRSSADWAEVASRHYYTDQAHLVHEFRHLAGTTPSHVALSDFYNL